jgi:hypothetical protein
MFRFIKNLKEKKYLKYILIGIIFTYAGIGFFLTSAFFAVKLHLTDDPGAVDYNDRYFKEIADKYDDARTYDTTQANLREADIYRKVLAINQIYPKNASMIMDAYQKSKNISEIERMIEAVNMHLQQNPEQLKQVQEIEKKLAETKAKQSKASIFTWMNISEWTDFRYAVAKDKAIIDSVARQTGVESRLIVSCLVGEQIRLFNSKREAYKKWIGPLKILSVETTFSFGVTGIKEHTAQQIEHNLKDTTTVFYLGKKYRNLLNFHTDTIQGERFRRLTNYHNHYYSYMYAALFLKQINQQWKKAGFPIENRPEILATLFNVGFAMSQPKSHPRVGGSTIIIDEKPYTFGAVAYDFYYSGDLFELFPFENKRFVD